MAATVESIERIETRDGHWIRVLADGSVERYTPPEPDWDRIDSLTDDDIDAANAEDPDYVADIAAAVRDGRMSWTADRNKK